MTILRFYALNALDEAKTAAVLAQLQQVNAAITGLRTEKCYHVELAAVAATAGTAVDASPRTEAILNWLFKHPQKAGGLTRSSALRPDAVHLLELEVGPRFNFSTAQSTNSVSICQNVGLTGIRRIEVSIKYQLTVSAEAVSADGDTERLFAALGDRMTQCLYTDANLPRASFDERLPAPAGASWYTVPVLRDGRAAIERVNAELGLSFDDWDLDFYAHLFGEVLKRDATSVELFDCAQSNSEHSRHWFFKGLMIVDGVPQEQSLIRMIIDTQKRSNANNTISFSDNSSAIRGYRHSALRPDSATGPGAVRIAQVESDLIFTAETHNMPTAVAPFSGATTGTGGRIRDVQGVGRGGHTIAGTAGYCVGRLHVPGYAQPFEGEPEAYPATFERPLRIIVEASNGASDYGNKFGEPVIAGFALSYGVRNADGERDEYVKPIMFSAGLGTMDSAQTEKLQPERGQLLAKIGGPVYRIGVGGGAASSVEVQGSNSAELDFNAVQRGDAEMENKLNRVVRACIELGTANPIVAIHDQGAGGNGNVLKELVEPGFAGAVIFTDEFQLGDPTITALELWGAEYQENNAVLVRAADRQLMEEICARERCPISFVGVVSGTGLVTLVEGPADFEHIERYSQAEAVTPFNMHLKDVLGDMPRKEYQLERRPKQLQALRLPAGDYAAHLERVLGVLSVASKRFLTNKVDRCVTGLIAQQQCVGPLHTPLADYAATAVAHFGYEGCATSIGTQPAKGLIDAAAGARMSVAEALSNLAFVRISELADVKCSGNWMWAAKLPGEGAKMYDACRAMCELMGVLRIAVDGGKDSLSMAARVDGETVRSPGTLVISTYVQCPDVREKVTPDLKGPQAGVAGELVYVNVEGRFRLGGSVLAQAYGQQGDDVPDIGRPETLRRAFQVTQTLLAQHKLWAGHDCSDGGLVVCLLEMAFGGVCGLDVDLTAIETALPAERFASNGHTDAALAMLFAEECGWVLEVSAADVDSVLAQFADQEVPAYRVGRSVGKGLRSAVSIRSGERQLLAGTTLEYFKQWERTSFELEKLQMNVACAEQEFGTYEYRTGPHYRFEYASGATVQRPGRLTAAPVVACVREEGSNGDREMMATLLQAQFEVHDVTMADLLAGRTTLDRYRGVVFPGGFSYADTLGSAKGWAASIMYSERVAPQFAHFRGRADTFSLGVCNGCQLMSLIGWVGGDAGDSVAAVRQPGEVIEVPEVALLENRSGRFECRWVALQVPANRSVMLRGLAGSTLGCWLAHGEGRFSFREPTVLAGLVADECVSLRYVDDEGRPTEVYPMNPNGSEQGVAAVCSRDGRHLAMMPHPERCSQMWQWPYVEAGFEPARSPWQCMFDEAYEWCVRAE